MALPPQKRPTYSQPSIMPRKQWVVVKTERMEDDDLIVVSGEEGGEDEEDEDEREMELARERERSDFNISNVRSLSAELGGRAENDMDSQVSWECVEYSGYYSIFQNIQIAEVFVCRKISFYTTTRGRQRCKI